MQIRLTKLTVIIWKQLPTLWVITIPQKMRYFTICQKSQCNHFAEEALTIFAIVCPRLWVPFWDVPLVHFHLTLILCHSVRLSQGHVIGTLDLFFCLYSLLALRSLGFWHNPDNNQICPVNYVPPKVLCGQNSAKGNQPVKEAILEPQEESYF